MARMIGHDAYWGLCVCCNHSSHRQLKRRTKRREQQNWKREVREWLSGS